MALNGRVYGMPDGVHGFDANVVITPKVASAFHDRGYRFAVRYVPRKEFHKNDLTRAEAETILAAGLGLMPVQHVESETSWIPDGDKGAAYGAVAAATAKQIGIPAGVNLWCDLEGVAKDLPASQIIAFCNRWHEAVAIAGYEPGLYVGWHCGLSPVQLYRSLRFAHYWASYNLNTDEYPAERGIQMKQSARTSDDLVPGVTFEFQVNRVRADRRGGRPYLLAADGWPER